MSGTHSEASPAAASNSPSAGSGKRVAVVGAGIAGLACARELTRHGLEVTVFEKSRGVGGRMATRRTDTGARFDHGAQYFTVRDETFQQVVSEWLEAGVVTRWDGRICSLAHGKPEPKEQVIPRYVGTPGMNSACKHLAEGIPIHLQARIETVERIDDRWRLRDTEGAERGLFDAFLTTAPAPQSAALLAAAPHLQKSAQSVTMHGCWAAMLTFDRRLEVDFDGAFVGRSPLSWIARNSNKPQRSDMPDSWVLHASPTWTTEQLEQPSEQVLAQMLEAFWQATGHHSVKPSYSTVHRWRYAIPPEPLTQSCLFDHELKMGAAGDWCNGPRVEGAYLSGIALAAAVQNDQTSALGTTPLEGA